MQNSSRSTGKVAVTVSSLVLCAAGSLLNPGISAAADEKPTDVVVSKSWEILGFHSYFDESMTCPADHPYLVNQFLAEGRFLPRGVSVDEPGSVGVSGSTSGTQSYATGVQKMSLSNWNPAKSATAVVSLHCTSDMTRAARGF